MVTTNLEKLEFVDLMYKNFPYTLFQWWYEKDEELKSSKHRTYDLIENKFIFLQKKKLYRTLLWNDKTDEIILDFDHEDLDENLREVKLVIDKLNLLKIKKYEVYLSGGKGVHLHFRYDFSPFYSYDMQQVRETVFESLDLDIKIDKGLFRTQQPIGLEGYYHRKTNKPKQRIQFFNSNCYQVLDKHINLEYLKDSFVNSFDSNFIETIQCTLSSSKHPPHSINHPIDISKKTNYDIKTFQKHLKRFAELYLTNQVNGSTNRFTDMVTRYIYLTTKDVTQTRLYLQQFCNQINLKIDITGRVNSTIKSMRSNAIFIYRDVLTKEKFYQNYKISSVANAIHVMNRLIIN